MLLHQKNTYLLYLIILLIGEIGFISTNIYLPSLPAIAENLHTQPHEVEYTITSYLFGFGWSQFIYGPLSDYYGRRKIILIGLNLTLLGSFICLVSTRIDVLIVARFIQGSGTGAGTVMARAILSDLFTGLNLAKAGSFYGMIATQLLALMPIIGGYIQVHLGWRANFGFLLFYTLLTLLLVFKYLPETSKSKSIYPLKLILLIRCYKKLLSDPIFLGCVLCSSFCLTGLISYSTMSPFLFQERLHLTPVQYGWLSLIGAGAFSLSGFLNGVLVSRLGLQKILVWGVLCMIGGGFILVLFSLIHYTSILSVMVPLFIFMVGANWIFCNTAAMAMIPLADIVGTAGALFGAVQIIISSIGSGVIAHWHDSNQFYLGVIFSGVALLNAFIFHFLLYDREIK